MKVKSLLDYPETHRPMAHEQMQDFIKCHFATAALGNKMAPVLDLANPKSADPKPQWARIIDLPCVDIFLQRLREQAPATKFHPIMIVFIAPEMTSPGICVMWAYTMHRMYQKLGDTIDINGYAELFPMAVPTTETYDACWKGQKARHHNLPGDNLLDQQEYWA